MRNLLREGLPTQPASDGEECPAKDEWENTPREVHHSIPHHAQPIHNTNSSQTYHQFSQPSHQQLSFNQSSYHPSSPHPNSPHQEDPVTFQVPSAYTVRLIFSTELKCLSISCCFYGRGPVIDHLFYSLIGFHVHSLPTTAFASDLHLIR